MEKVYVNFKTERSEKEKLNDFQLTPDELFAKYQDMPKVIYRINRGRLPETGFFLEEDYIQCGMMGLFKASRMYSPAYDSRFPSFAWKIIVNAMIDAARKAKVFKVAPVTVSLDELGEQGKEIAFFDNELGVIFQSDLKLAYEKASPSDKKGIDWLLMKHTNNMLSSEIAAVFHSNERTVRSYMSRATTYLRSCPFMKDYRK